MLTILFCFIFYSFRAVCTKCVQRFVGSCWCVDTYAGRSVDSSVCALLNVRHSALTITVGRYNSYYHSHNSIIFPLSRVAVNLVRHVMSLVAGSVRIRVVKTFAVSLVQHLPALYPALRYQTANMNVQVGFSFSWGFQGTADMHHLIISKIVLSRRTSYI